MTNHNLAHKMLNLVPIYL